MEARSIMRLKSTHRARFAICSIVVATSLPSILAAQGATQTSPLPLTLLLPVGSAAESYVRYAQTLGIRAATPWMIRPLSNAISRVPHDSSSDGMKYLLGDRPVRRTGALVWQILPVNASVWYNSTYPFGWNDGAVWRGRGATGSVDGGLAAQWKAFSLTLNPSGYLSENRPFPLMPVSSGGPFTDPLALSNIDRPQRFGERSYGQLLGGQSTLRVDAFGLTAGASTANQWLGPMNEWPFLLGNNAAGFPRVFVGSASPWNVLIGKVHGQVFYGGLSQSAYMPDPDTISGRVISGIAGSFSFRFLPGLEIGGGRIFEYAWPRQGFGGADIRKPLEAFLKEHVQPDSGLFENQSADNQLVSVFARWVMPSSGFEAYAEFGRDDHSWNARDAIAEPEHDAAYGLGVRKAWLVADGVIRAFRAEIFNMEPSTLRRARAQGNWYAHSFTRQGHTQMGQVLGAGFAAIAGSGSMMALERFSPAGERSAISLSRMVMRERTAAPSVDAEYAFAAEQTRPMGAVRFTYGITAVYNVNRYFTADVGNVMATLGVRW